MSIKWKILDINLRDVGSADSVEVTHMTIRAYDSVGSGVTSNFAEEQIDWVPKNPIYYQDSATARAVAQSSAFDNWLEIDSDHTRWMERVEWVVRTRIWNADHHSGGDSYKLTKTIQLSDSAEVVNPLGL